MTLSPRTERNYLPLARSQNRAAWAKNSDLVHGASLTEAMDRITTDFEESADRVQARWLAARRARLTANINAVAELPGMFWRHLYFHDLPGGMAMSTDDAVAGLRREMALERRRKGHWSHRPSRTLQLQEALVFARFFRRFGRRAWMREAA